MVPYFSNHHNMGVTIGNSSAISCITEEGPVSHQDHACSLAKMFWLLLGTCITCPVLMKSTLALAYVSLIIGRTNNLLLLNLAKSGLSQWFWIFCQTKSSMPSLAWFDRRFKNHWLLTRVVGTHFNHCGKTKTAMSIYRLVSWCKRLIQAGKG